jgi:hypothetical protein
MEHGTSAWTLAAPSCVLPVGLAENCAYLAAEYQEVSLAFFETDACLAYTPEDLPAALAGLPLRYSMHLPLDLPWAEGVAAVAEIILELARLAGFLAPWAYVLHPPQGPGVLDELAARLERGGLPPGRLLVENIQGRDLAVHWPVIRARGLGVCLDLGHMLLHGQEDFLDLPGLAGHTRMVHLNAPDPRRYGRHASLRTLDAGGRALMGRLVGALPAGGSVVLELFTERELRDSRDYFTECMGAVARGA